MTFSPDSEHIRKLHKSYFRVDPTDEQCALYNAFPSAYGFSDPERNEDRFQAVLTLALIQTIPPEPAVNAHSRMTYVFYPKKCEPWVVKEIGRNAEEIFGWLRKDTSPGRVKAAQFMGDSFQALRLGHLILQVPEAPLHWVAFGFKREDPIPDWMRDKLL